MNKLYKNISKIDFKAFDMQVEDIRSSIEKNLLVTLKKKKGLKSYMKKQCIHYQDLK